MIVNLLQTIALLCVSIFGPGLLIIRYLDWNPADKFAGTIGISLVFNYLAIFAIYISHTQYPAHHILVVFNSLVFLSHWRLFKSLIQDAYVSRMLSGYAIILVWLFLCNGLIHSFSGGMWRGDWYEHYHRSLFFLNNLPLDTLFLEIYTLPSRPPLMNLLASHYMAILGSDFSIFQLTFSMLNALSIFAVFLLANRLSRGSLAVTLPVIVLLMFSPLYIQNTTYTWTKQLTVFFVLYGTYLYITSLHSSNRTVLTMAWVMLAGGILTHYSAIPYALFILLHYVVYVFYKNRGMVLDFFRNMLAAGMILLTWFGWSAINYGADVTVLSNTAVTDVHGLSLYDNLLKVLYNIYFSIVPHFLSGTGNLVFRLQDFPGYPRDFTFLLYQTNLLFAFGSMGLVTIIYILTRISGVSLNKAALFWIFFTGFNLVLGIAVHGTLDPYGVIHICLQPVILLGLAFIAVHYYKLPRLARLLLLFGLALDFLLGIVLHLYVQGIDLAGSTGTRLGTTFHHNLKMKSDTGVVFISDQLASYQGLLWFALVAFSLLAFIMMEKKPGNSVE